VRTLLKQGNRDAALAAWRSISELTRLLFAEPSPAPAKYWLARKGLIDSAEVRLPMVEVSAELAARLDAEIERRNRHGEERLVHCSSTREGGSDQAIHGSFQAHGLPR
jgi:4-hydroxy-tetrahydrodipicolinate synthase